ncbi:MAG: hypothetical protein LUD15_04425, partial [Bacteroides sp.]|nr:hypothetical protein [Bacteroides sp.]
DIINTELSNECRDESTHTVFCYYKVTARCENRFLPCIKSGYEAAGKKPLAVKSAATIVSLIYSP